MRAWQGCNQGGGSGGGTGTGSGSGRPGREAGINQHAHQPTCLHGTGCVLNAERHAAQVDLHSIEAAAAAYVSWLICTV